MIDGLPSEERTYTCSPVGPLSCEPKPLGCKGIRQLGAPESLESRELTSSECFKSMDLAKIFKIKYIYN